MVTVAWLLLPVAAMGVQFAGAAVPHVDRECVELCSDWYVGLVQRGFGIVLVVSAVVNGSVLSAPSDVPRTPRHNLRGLVASAAMLLVGSAWVIGVIFGVGILETLGGIGVVAGSFVVFAFALHERQP